MAAHTPLHKSSAPHRELWRRYRVHMSEREYKLSLALSFFSFCGSIVLSFFAIRYAAERASNPVTDLFLSNVPAINIDGIFVYSTLLLIIYVTLLLLAHPKRLPFALNAMALFYLIRAVFITLTHLGPFPAPAPDGDWGLIISRFLFSGDLFFSGHTGIPFLLALVFWKEKRLRHLFLGWSALMATIVLLGHYHYSIDVASAFFITYTIYHIAEFLFPAERALFYSDRA